MCLLLPTNLEKPLHSFLYYKINRSLGPRRGSRDLAVFITRKTENGGSRQAVLIIATLAFIAVLGFPFLMQMRNLK